VTDGRQSQTYKLRFWENALKVVTKSKQFQKKIKLKFKKLKIKFLQTTSFSIDFISMQLLSGEIRALNRLVIGPAIFCVF
jgi:hypothetical protein